MPGNIKPPYDVDAEKNVLASIMLDKEALIKAADRLIPDDFYDPAHKAIYEASITLFQQSSPVDSVTVKAYLSKGKVLNKATIKNYMSEITGILPLTTNVEFYSKIIKEASLRRKIISMSSDLVGMGMNEERKLDDILDDIEKRVYEISEGNVTKSFVTIQDLLMDADRRLNDPNEEDRAILQGFSTGFTNLIFHNGELVIIAARPSVGKTAFMLEIVRYFATQLNKSVAVFSLEMDRDQIADRLLSLQSEIGLSDIRSGLVSQNPSLGNAYQKATDALYGTKLYIDDTPGLHINDLRTRTRKLDLEVGIDAVFVDYLQLLQGRSKDNRAQEVSEITQGLKNIARELRVPVIALSQLNRGVETRTDKKPQLSDLRESGAIEQDADIVVFLHRESYYVADKGNPGASENSEITDKEDRTAKAIISKNRNGPTGETRLVFVYECAKYKNGEN